MNSDNYSFYEQATENGHSISTVQRENNKYAVSAFWLSITINIYQTLVVPMSLADEKVNCKDKTITLLEHSH